MLHYLARPHEGPASRPVGGPAAWKRADLPTAESLFEALSANEVDEARRAVDHAVRTGKPTGAMRREDLPLPTLGPRIHGFREVLSRGRGFVLLRGLPVDRWSTEESERFFWGFGLHLGIPGAQNPQGDLLGHVRDQGFADQVDVRGYRTRANIAFHCDAADVVGLLCLRAAVRGGKSRIASSVAVHDALLASRPDLAEDLYEPFLLDTKGEGGMRYFPVPPCRYAHGRLRTFWHTDYFGSVDRLPGAPPLGAKRRELIALYEELAGSPDFCFEMDLAPGDVQLLSNHTIVHGRTAFEDSAVPGEHRHLLRLWLSLPGENPWPETARAFLGLVGRLGLEKLRQRS